MCTVACHHVLTCMAASTSCIQEFFAWAPGEQPAGGAYDPLRAIQVGESSGWTLQLNYNDKHGRLEPGYFADNYPSVLELEVDSTFPELGDHFGQLLVTFKSSPDGYGQARISCPATVPTCTCNGYDMDAAARGAPPWQRL